jgi:hypothetical protein
VGEAGYSLSFEDGDRILAPARQLNLPRLARPVDAKGLVSREPIGHAVKDLQKTLERLSGTTHSDSLGCHDVP